MNEVYKNTKQCDYFIKGRKCINDNSCGQKLETKEGKICVSEKYYAIDLEKELKRLKWYLNEIRDVELKELDIDWDEYETGKYDTDYSTIINLIEEALYERPQEDCRYNND